MTETEWTTTAAEPGDAIIEEAEHVSSLLATAADFVKGILPSLGFAALVFFAGILLMKLLMKTIRRGLEKSKLDPTAASFLQSLIQAALYVLVTIMTLSVLKVPMTSIITVIGTMGLAIGLAVQDSLSNVAGGFLVLFSKPLKVGDFVELNGITGTVERIEILQTKLRRPDGTSVFMPNGKIADAVVINYTDTPERRLELSFGIGYDSDSEQAKALVHEVLQKNPYVLQVPAPLVRVGGLEDSAVMLHVKVWTKNEHYWPLYYDLHEQVKLIFEQNHITIPYPQMDVHADK